MIDDDKDFGRTPGSQRRRPGRRRGGKKRVCRYCADKTLVIDYKDPQALKYFITERGKVVPRRISGNCARHQRKVHARHQAGAQHRAPALHRHGLRGARSCLPTSRSSSSTTSTRSARPGSSCKVRPGFARNYLLPRQLAVPATTAAVNRIEHEKAVAVAKAEKAKKGARDARREDQRPHDHDRRRTVGEDERLFGSVTAKEIETAVKAQGLDVRPQEDAPRRADQGARHVRDPGEALDRRDGHAQGGSRRRSSCARPLRRRALVRSTRLGIASRDDRGVSHLGGWRCGQDARQVGSKRWRSRRRSKGACRRTTSTRRGASSAPSCSIPRALDKVLEFLKPEHFYSEAHRRIYEACVELRAKGKPVDVVQVATWLRDRERLAQVGGHGLPDRGPQRGAGGGERRRLRADHPREVARPAAHPRRASASPAQGYVDYGEAQQFIDARRAGRLRHRPHAASRRSVEQLRDVMQGDLQRS